MKTLSNGNTFRVTSPLWEESTGHRWIPLTKGQWRGALMFFLWNAPEQTAKQTIEMMVTRYAMALIMTSLSLQWGRAILFDGSHIPGPRGDLGVLELWLSTWRLQTEGYPTRWKAAKHFFLCSETSGDNDNPDAALSHVGHIPWE